jgi:hypothetical protein
MPAIVGRHFRHKATFGRGFGRLAPAISLSQFIGRSEGHPGQY